MTTLLQRQNYMQEREKNTYNPHNAAQLVQLGSETTSDPSPQKRGLKPETANQLLGCAVPDAPEAMNIALAAGSFMSS